MKIAILGAESTGKTALAEAISRHLRSRGHPVVHVAEVLREWCDREGRTPLAHEQAGIAGEQARRADAVPAGAFVVADTTPLMTAIYSDLLFQDHSLYETALAHQRGYDLTLVTGLDLPWVADGLQRDGAHVREPVDALLRAALSRAGIAYKVVYGEGPDRTANALAAIDTALREMPAGHTAWSGYCDKCSDPACEHRLFTALLKSKAAGRPVP